MKSIMTRGYVCLCLVGVVAIALFSTTTGDAAPPESFTIEFALTLTGPDSASGTFTASGTISDSGNASQTFRLVPPGDAPRTAHGVKTLEGSQGTITISFHARVIPESPTTSVAEGRFRVISGTGEYENLRATGTTSATLDLATGTLTGTYTGSTHTE